MRGHQVQAQDVRSWQHVHLRSMEGVTLPGNQNNEDSVNEILGGIANDYSGQLVLKRGSPPTTASARWDKSSKGSQTVNKNRPLLFEASRSTAVSL